jgi:hypothetical protein
MKTRIPSRIGIPLLALLVTAGISWALRIESYNCLDLGPLNTFPENSVSYHECGPTFLVRGRGPSITVFLAETPHLPNEPLDWDEGSRTFLGLHGEAFDLAGQILTGPAQRPLWRCPTTIRDKRVYIDPPEEAREERLPQICKG